MGSEIGTILVLVAGAYVLAGLLVGLAFVARGVGAVDSGARSAGIGFRLVILPGVVALWPIVLRMWIAALRRAGGHA
jgi:hypothetical protein